MLRSLSRLPLLLLLAGLGANCSSKDSGSNGSGATGSGATGSGATGSGATSSGGSGHTYVPPTCGQPCQDYLVGWALDDTVWFLWNQKVAGHPVGVQDISGPCPLGGSVHFTGMDSVADGTTTTAIQVLLDACENTNQQYDLTFTGTVSMDGSFNSDTSFGAEVFSAPGLDVTGALNWLDDPPIGEGCDVTVSQHGVGKSSALSGRVCGRDIDKSALDTTSSSSGGSGQGGSSSTAGTSGSDCSCICPDGRDCTDAPGANPCGIDADGIPNACACPIDCP